MGLDFSALIQYAGPTGDSLGAIAELEAGPGPPELRGVVETGRRQGFAFAELAGNRAEWRSRDDWECILPERPPLPCLGATLELPSGFGLTFGADAVWVGHYVRWVFFVTEGEWQRVLLGAVRWLCRTLGALDCIIAHDGHPAVLAFQEGASFQQALQIAEDRGEGAVSSIGDLYIDAGYAEDLVYLGPGGEELAIPLWDTHGFWRFAFRERDSG